MFLAALIAPATAFAQDANTDITSDSATELNNHIDSQSDIMNNAPAAVTMATVDDPTVLSQAKKIEQLDFALAMATIALRRGDLITAQENINFGLSLKMDNAQLYYLNGLILSSWQKWDAAIGSLLKARELDPSMDISFELANAYYYANDLAKAQEHLGNCRSARCDLLRGLMNLDQADYATAANHFDKSAAAAQAEDPKSALPAYFYSASTKLSMGQFKEARLTLDQGRPTAKNHAPWDILFAGLKRNLQLFNFYGSLGLHFDSNIANISEQALQQRKMDGESNLADLCFDLNLAGNFRYFFTNKIRLNVNWGFTQSLYLLEGPETRKYNMTNALGGLGLAFGWGKRPALNYVDISYNIHSAWALGEEHKKDIGLDFFALTQEVGPTVNLTLGNNDNLNMGAHLLIDIFDDSAFIPDIASKDARSAIGERFHALYMHHTSSSFSLGSLLNGGYANAHNDDYDRGYFGANFRLHWQTSYRGSLAANIGYSLYDYLKNSQDRFDNQMDISVRIGSLLNTFMNLGIDIMYTHRWSTIEVYEFDRIMVGMTLAFTL